ncbi:histidinol-phosphate transaminase [Sporosarcina sp. Te-1]|uniref:histidinol-phosphate transaminase n=1 Tax=Sporosarcina sp. Te-1 TaxID=2818390 RepID=UPI001A9F9014|nr:histidinol-phosphate transaminase [Sporosarcina sp. Te-1]QTD42176.1 histidinol-phosphate transaminase [Sporosarcina sp. Te-1]
MKWKTALEEMKPYKPGRSIEDVKRTYGLTHIVKLASNENPYGTSQEVLDYLDQNPLQYEIYPDGHSSRLRKKLAEKHGVSEESILFGNGSDEIITIICRALLDEGKHTIMATPTFPQYAHNAKIEGAAITEIPLKDGLHDLDAFLKAITKDTTVIWICNPNNPTGTLMPVGEIVDFLHHVPEDVLVVLDEAYFEYITDDQHVDSISLLEQLNNIIVLRTFSKAYGLASMRLGYGIAHPAVVTPLNKVRNPFNNNSLAVAVAEVAVQDKEFIEKCRSLNDQQRMRFKQFAAHHGLHMFDSQTNFVLIQVPSDADEASEFLLQQGYIVRSGNALGTPGYIRVTVGTEQQNDGFFTAFDKFLQQGGSHEE